MRFLKPVEPEAKPAKPTRRGIEMIQRLVDSFPLGARIRYHPEFDTESLLDGLVLGYGFDNQFIFMPQQLDFAGTESVPSIELTEPSLPRGRASLTRVDNFQILIPSDTGEERKLDYDRRVALGRNGPFTKGSQLSVITLGNGSENLRINCEVQRRIVLQSGPHRGLQVAVLNMQLGTVEAYEPRAQSRVETRTPATVCRDGSDKILPAFVLDVSEFFLRLALDPPEREWPSLSEKNFVLIALKPWSDKPILKLKCGFVREAGSERVFEIRQVLRQGKYVDFQTLDALELKIALMS